mgnify:CR=1 FL=1|tara:strand:- start:340 stop:1509 length:1170 start_codon:yes stop_codon:yes gene_type:complete
MKKILFLYDNFFTEYDYSRFQIAYLSKHFIIEVIDFTNFLNQKYYKKFYNKKLFYKNKKFSLIHIKNNNDLKNFFFKMKRKKNFNYLIDNMTKMNSRSFSIRKHLSELNSIKLVKINSGKIPMPNLGDKIIFSIINHNLYNDFKNKILSKIKKIKPVVKNNIIKNFNNYDIDIFTGLKNLKNISKHKIFSSTFDYSTFLKKGNKKKIKKNKEYAVYLEEIMVDHPDFYKDKNFKNPIKKKLFNKELLSFFKNFEKVTKLNIIYAMHPRNIFLNKKINFIPDNTADLVKNSKMVLLHASTAISYAILNKKPLLYLDSRNYSWMRPRIRAFMRETGGNVIDISNYDNLGLSEINLNKIDKLKYSNYIKNYIKHPKSNNGGWERHLMKFIKK